MLDLKKRQGELGSSGRTDVRSDLYVDRYLSGHGNFKGKFVDFQLAEEALCTVEYADHGYLSAESKGRSGANWRMLSRRRLLNSEE